MTTPMDHNDFPDLETERLLLRRIAQDDIEFVFRHFSDPRVAQYLLDEPPITELAQAQEIIQFYFESAGKAYNRWIMVRKSDQQPIGTVGFHKWAKRYFRAEIGYDLSPDFWGHGYMTEALKAVIPNGFGQMGLNRIEALIYSDNDPSIRLVERLGFKREGLLRDYFYLDQKFHDHYIYSLLKRDWET